MLEENRILEEQAIKQILGLTDLYEVLPFGRTKINQLIAANQLPVVKVGRDYITTPKILEDWIASHVGKEIYY